VAGTLCSTKKDDAIREAGTPPTRAALDRRTDRHFIRLVSNSVQHPCESYIEGWDQVDDDPDTMDSWLRRSSEGLWSRGQGVERTTPLPIRRGTRSIVAQVHLARTRQPTIQRWQLLKKALTRFLNPNKHLNIYQSCPTQHLPLLA
jgi:hypothetical protein